MEIGQAHDDDCVVAGRLTGAHANVSLAVAGIVAALVAVCRNGLGEYPFVGYLATEVAPNWPDLPSGVPPLFQFVLWAALGPALAHLAGISTTNAYLAMHAVVLVVGLGSFAVAVHRRLGPQTTLGVLLVLATLPATTVVLAWSGSYDTFTLVLSLLLVMCRSPRLAAVIGALMACNALEHGAFIVATLMLLAAAKVWGDVKVLVAAAGGLVAGGTVLIVWLRSQGIDHGRAYWLDHYGLGYFWDLTRQGWPLLLVSLFGVLWPLAVGLVHATGGRRRWIVTAALLIPILPTLVTEDQTRVFAILSAPALVALYLAQSERDAAVLRRPLLIARALAWTPGFFVWKGSAHITQWGPWALVLG